MPEQEFELYLSLLAKLLRLNPSQKAAITDELRDHLEERLGRLIESGLSRDQAIRQAMDEFGDMTGFALDMTRASRTPIRKVVVRSTLAASAVAACIVGAVVLFTPQHRAAAPQMVQAEPAEIVAVEQPAAVPAPAPKKQLASILNESDLFPEFLAKPISLSFDNTSFGQVMQDIEQMTSVPIVIHSKALAEESISTESYVSLHVTNVTLEEVLNLLTPKLQLTWQVDSGLIQITTPSSATFLTRQYNVRELIQAGHRFGSLIKILHMDSGNWEDVDGDGGTFAIVGETMIIRQTFLGQRQIARTLALIEEPPQSQALVGVCTGYARMKAILDQPADVNASDMPLSHVLKFLFEQHALPYEVDERSLAEEAISLDHMVSMKLSNRPLGKLLTLILDDLQLTYQIRNGLVRVLTKTEAENQMASKVYNLGDLSSSPQVLPQLMTAISRTVNGQWKEIQGEGGEAVPSAFGHLLFVKQTDQVHSEIEQLIQHLQLSWKNQAINEQTFMTPDLIIKTYKMPSEVAVNMLGAVQKFVEPSSWSKGGFDRPAIDVVASDPKLETIDGAVSGGANEVRMMNAPVGAQPDSKPQTTKPTSVVVRPMSILIIRQTPEIHQQIQKFLADMHLAVEVGVLNHNGKNQGMGGMTGGMGGGFGGGGMMGGAGAGGMGGGGGMF